MFTYSHANTTPFGQSERAYYLSYFININHDVKLSVLSLGHLISFSFTAEEVKGVNYFPSRANEQFEKRCYRQTACKFSEIYLYLSLRLV